MYCRIRNMKKLVILLGIAGSLQMISGCSDPNSMAPSSNYAHPEAYYNPQYKTTDYFHGTQIKTEGTESCYTCHGNDLKGSGDIPGCWECHFGPDGSKVPEEFDWDHALGLHSGLTDYELTCNICHDYERDYSTGPEACHDCHGSGINHITGQEWLDTKSSQFHGNVPLDDCSDCHNLSQKCYECHFGTTGNKSPGSWIHGLNDGHENLSQYDLICNQCHDLDRSYSNGPASCHDCHDIVINHVTGQEWLDKKSSQFHGNVPLDDCSSCHDLSQKCYECHFGSTGSKSPGSWIHGLNDAHRNYSQNAATCNQCHNLNRSYSNPPSSCHDCHGDGD
jgi:hypothetical protein